MGMNISSGDYMNVIDVNLHYIKQRNKTKNLN